VTWALSVEEQGKDSDQASLSTITIGPRPGRSYSTRSRASSQVHMCTGGHDASRLPMVGSKRPLPSSHGTDSAMLAIAGHLSFSRVILCTGAPARN
jgi:hypothetical protein